MHNSQMTAGRYLRWHRARRRKAWVDAMLATGRAVYLCTQLRAIKVTRPDQTKATKAGFFVARGKGWDCVDGTEMRAQ